MSYFLLVEEDTHQSYLLGVYDNIESIHEIVNCGDEPFPYKIVEGNIIEQKSQEECEI